MVSSTTRPKKRNSTPRFEKIFIPESSAGLARTHKIIKIEREKEIQFMKLCCQIRLNDSKKFRAESQKEERKMKRVNKYSLLTSD
jgi:hypothetical protein